jgi:hypothetical protein
MMPGNALAISPVVSTPSHVRVQPTVEQEAKIIPGPWVTVTNVPAGVHVQASVSTAGELAPAPDEAILGLLVAEGNARADVAAVDTPESAAERAEITAAWAEEQEAIIAGTES